MTKICVFDFDGTLTTRDTLLDFIRFCRGTPRMVLGFLLFSPLIVLMRLHLMSNEKVKQLVFSHFFRGMSREQFMSLGESYRERASQLLRHDTVAALKRYKAEGARVYVISASVEEWVAPVCKSIGADMVLGTRAEYAEDSNGVECLTGRFASRNCYGQEKVNRLLEVEPDRQSYHLTAYGDSRGDLEMFCFADVHHRV